MMEKSIFYGPQRLYNPELSKGMLVNIQVVGKKWEDEKVLAMMKVIDDALQDGDKGRSFGPGAWDRHQVTLEK